MIKIINVKKVLEDHDAEQSKPKALPVIVIRKPIIQQAKVVHEVDITRPDVKTDLVKALWIEYNSMLVERNKLSSEIAHLVEAGAETSKLFDHYNRIETYRPGLQDLYDKIKYVELHGDLPSVPEKIEDPETIYSLKLQRESVTDKRSKLKAKLAKKASQNPAKYSEWALELQQSNLLYQDLTDKIKKLEGKA